MNGPIGVIRPPAPRAARLAQLMVPPGGPCRAFIGQADLEVHRRPRAVDSASSHVMANVGVAALVCYRAAYVQA
jgi:hypothetical protein